MGVAIQTKEYHRSLGFEQPTPRRIELENTVNKRSRRNHRAVNGHAIENAELCDAALEWLIGGVLGLSDRHGPAAFVHRTCAQASGL